MTDEQKEQIRQLLNRKLVARGFWITLDGPKPPEGMGGFAVQEIINKCQREATDEILGIKAVPIPVPEGGVTAGDGPFWHDQNPWNDHLVYVPLEELARCHVGLGKPFAFFDGKPINYTVEHILDNWSQHGTKLDAYILTGKTFTAGVRFGPEGADYLSPGFSTPELWALLQKYRSQNRKAS